MIDLDQLERLAKAATRDNWIVQSTYGGKRLMDECSDTPFSCVLPESGSWPEDTICEVWGTEHDDEANAAFIAACDPATILELVAEVRRLREEKSALKHDLSSYMAIAQEYLTEIEVWRSEAVAHQAFVDAFNASSDGESPAELEAHARWEAAIEASRPYKQEAIDAARKEKA